ncbi:MAG: nucleotidyltransferase domain-containing protein [Cryomorphaceae bacterium]
MYLKTYLGSRISEFKELCHAHDVENLYAFGSATNENFDEESSDVDLLIEVKSEDPIERGEKLMAIWDKLEIFFQKKVDLLTNSGIKNPILRKNIDATKILIYDGKEQKVLI